MGHRGVTAGSPLFGLDAYFPGDLDIFLLLNTSGMRGLGGRYSVRRLRRSRVKYRSDLRCDSELSENTTLDISIPAPWGATGTDLQYAWASDTPGLAIRQG
ncbi:hypothetical protein NHX12_029160 [Muraenolepis orangiensis]|uniref:Uncharacterized protein n=1 Tax=Muraenolepis orangiensis TaxID=630683 RepID=A0A9Q0IMW7_9TELE|nr:hypothetical protein NHX12_029160 [Muraenolepis orangiensis]